MPTTNELYSAYATLSAASNIEVGDTVKVLRAADNDHKMGWNNAWNSVNMDHTIGKSLIVRGVQAACAGVQLIVRDAPGEVYYNYPFYVLEVVKKAKRIDVKYTDERGRDITHLVSKETRIKIAENTSD